MVVVSVEGVESSLDESRSQSISMSFLQKIEYKSGEIACTTKNPGQVERRVQGVGVGMSISHGARLRAHPVCCYAEGDRAVQAGYQVLTLAFRRRVLNGTAYCGQVGAGRMVDISTIIGMPPYGYLSRHPSSCTAVVLRAFPTWEFDPTCKVSHRIKHLSI